MRWFLVFIQYLKIVTDVEMAHCFPVMRAFNYIDTTYLLQCRMLTSTTVVTVQLWQTEIRVEKMFGSKRISRKVDLVVAFSPVLNLRN